MQLEEKEAWLRKPHPLKRVRLIALDLKPEQRALLNQFMKDARKTYNLALDYLNTHELIKGMNQVAQRQKMSDLEKHLVKNFVSKPATQGKILNTPKVIRQQAVKNLCSHMKGYYTRIDNELKSRAECKKKGIKRQDRAVKAKFKFKARRFTRDAIHIEKRSIHQVDGFSFSLYCRKYDGKLKGIKIKGRQPLEPSMFEKDFSLVFQHGQWYFAAPVYWEDFARVIWHRDQMVALDPGVRKFLTTYSPEGKVEVLGANPKTVLLPLMERRAFTKILSDQGYENYLYQKNPWNNPGVTRIEKAKLRKRNRRRRQRYQKAQKRLENVVKDMHYKVAHHLCRNYEQIIYPNFSSKSCSKRKGRKINKGTVMLMQALSFYKFKCRLIQTSSKYAGTGIITGSEAYTSKQCGQCGYLNDKLSGSEVFTCHKCGCGGDRDAHAARNIALRFLRCGSCCASDRKSCKDCAKVVKVDL
jgi:putative transposase